MPGSQSTSDAITAATKFNEAVESTAVVGALVAEVRDVKVDLTEMRGDVKHIRARIDNWTGRATILGAVVALVASLAVSLFGQPFAHALALRLVGQ